jgi:hypothetical protein
VNQEKFQQTTTKKGSVDSSHEEETQCGTLCPPTSSRTSLGQGSKKEGRGSQ